MFQLVIQTVDVTVFSQVIVLHSIWAIEILKSSILAVKKSRSPGQTVRASSCRWRNLEAAEWSAQGGYAQGRWLKYLTSTELIEKCSLYTIRAEYTVDGGGKQPQIL